MALTVRNWAEFQHYRDRSPPWIKLHRSILDNVDYFMLSPEAAKCLPLVWLIASEAGGALPSLDKLAFRMRVSQAVAESVVAELTAREFLGAETSEQVATTLQPKGCDWPSRYVSAPIKATVWKRDGGKCVACGSVQNIEYDHCLPVSKGGESTVENLQLLCRKCNRKKRQRSFATQNCTLATQTLNMRSLETEGEIEGKKPIVQQAARFSDFWAAYPVKKGKAVAARKWKARKLDAVADTILADIAARLATDRQWIDGYIPHASTYVNGSGWEDGIEPVRQSGPVHNPGGTSPPKVETAQTRAEDARLYAQRMIDLGQWTVEQARDHVRAAR